MFCNLDELMTSLLFFCFLLRYTIDYFRNTCDKKIILDSVDHFQSMRQNVQWVTGLLPAVLTFREAIFELYCIITTARENLFKSAFKV